MTPQVWRGQDLNLRPTDHASAHVRPRPSRPILLRGVSAGQSTRAIAPPTTTIASWRPALADVCALPDDVRSAHDAGSRASSSFTQPRFHQGLLRDLRALGVCSRGPRRSAVFPPRVRLRELHLERRTTRRRSSPLTSRVCSGGLGKRKKAPLPGPPASLPRLDSSLGNYPTGIPINRLSSRNRPTTKMPMDPRAIKVLTLPGKCSHRSKSRSHHLSSPSPSRSSTMPPDGVGPQLRIGENARLLQSFGGQCSHPEPAQHGEPASRTSLASAAVPAVPRRRRVR